MEPEKRSSDTKNLEEEVEALKKELGAERTKMQKEMTKWEEQKKVFAASLAAARGDAKQTRGGGPQNA